MPNDVQFYSHHARELAHTQQEKIERFLEQDAIEYDKENKRFICKPIMQRNGKPYNHTTYTIRAIKEGFSCDCQGYVTKARKRAGDPTQPVASCSHIGALFEWLKRRDMARREYNTRQAMLGMF